MITTEQLYAYYQKHPQVETDTRKIKKGAIFFALKGPHFDGNAYAEEALKKGAEYAIIDDVSRQTNSRMLLVSDVIDALQKIASYHRDQFQIPFIAITGSNGKTTTKELTKAVLSTTYRTYATEGNLNNHIGIPLTLLRIKPDIEIALIEMGANHQKEIESYCKIVKPTHGLITNIGKAHLEGFGGLEGVRKGKGELFDFLKAHQGTAFACKDFSYFDEMTQGILNVIWYSTSEKGSVHGKVSQKSPYLQAELNYGKKINTNLAGAYNIYNILAAATVGKYYKVSEKDIHKAISNYHPDNARSQVIHRGDNVFVLDAYNANPSSMQAAIENFAERPELSKVLLLGAMMELGKDSINEHQQLIELIQKYKWETVVLVGGDFNKTKHPFLYFSDAASVKTWFQQQKFHNVAVLIKGSRKIEMEKIITD